MVEIGYTQDEDGNAILDDNSMREMIEAMSKGDKIMLFRTSICNNPRVSEDRGSFFATDCEGDIHRRRDLSVFRYYYALRYEMYCPYE